VEPDWPIIIGGSHRSGTTLLRRLLNGHPRIFCPSEVKFYKDLLCQYPADPLAHARLGASIRALRLPLETWLDAFGRALCECYRLAALRAGKPRWADKNPENALNAGHWDRLLQGRLAFVLVTRHPLDVVASMNEIAMNGVISTDLRGRATHVRDYLAAGLDFIDAHPTLGTIVRYERLVTDPVAVLTELLSFVGEGYEASMVATLYENQQAEGLEDPKFILHAGVSTAHVGRWRTDLSSEQIRLIDPIVAPIARRLAYVL
jgi:protein-tyrosine sulfotransferase